MPDPLTSREGLHRLVAAAAAAPSVHNTQPWRFTVRDGDVVELRLDPARRLAVADPRGRAMVTSCGAALMNLRLAMLTAGYQASVRSLAGNEEDPTLLAEIRTGRRVTASPTEHRLYAAILLRHSNRKPFTGKRVPPEVWKALTAAARAESGELWPVERGETADVLDTVRQAERRLLADPAYRAELGRWTHERQRRDGVPRYAFDAPPKGGGLPLRAFDPETGARAEKFERSPQLAMLTGHGDGPRSWLRAGQALQRVLLTATDAGVDTTLLTQPLDVRDIDRRAEWAEHDGRRHVQAIIRVGYGPRSPATPRRPVEEILTA